MSLGPGIIHVIALLRALGRISHGLAGLSLEEAQRLQPERFCSPIAQPFSSAKAVQFGIYKGRCFVQHEFARMLDYISLVSESVWQMRRQFIHWGRIAVLLSPRLQSLGLFLPHCFGQLRSVAHLNTFALRATLSGFSWPKVFMTWLFEAFIGLRL